MVMVMMMMIVTVMTRRGKRAAGAGHQVDPDGGGGGDAECGRGRPGHGGGGGGGAGTGAQVTPLCTPLLYYEACVHLYCIMRLVFRTGVSHSDVSGRSWARVTGACVECGKARSVEIRTVEDRSVEARSVETRGVEARGSQGVARSPPRPRGSSSQSQSSSLNPELAEAGERIIQVRTMQCVMSRSWSRVKNVCCMT